MPGEAVDGMDVLAMRDSVGRAVERARKDRTATLIEARTYRFRGHSMRDPAGAVYRTKDEVEREKLRDPIVLFRERALKAGWLSDDDVRDIDKSVNFLGGHGIVGAHLPLAAGAGFAIKYQGGDQVVLCYFGDGAVPEGEFHESMNLAALWKLPVIFICENNRYAMGTAIHRALAQTDIWRFAETYGIPGEAVDGMDVLAVRDVVARAVERARRDKTPALIEARTYRFRGHSMRDPAGSVYRTKEEVEREKLRDPIALFSDRCLKEGVLTEADVRNIEKAVNDLADEAVAFAEASPEPPPSELFTDVYKD